MEFPIHLPDALAFITSAAGIAWWCTAVSDFFRNQPGDGWFAGLTALWRQVVVYAAMAALPIAGYLVIQFVPAGFIEAAAPHFAFAMMLLTALLAVRVVYEVTKHRPAASARPAWSEPLEAEMLALRESEDTEVRSAAA